MNRKIGVVGGTGPEGSGLAKRWAAAGEHIVIGSRDAERAAEAAKLLRQRLGSAAHIESAENSAVVSCCDVIVLTVPFAGQVALLKQLKPAWKPGQILIDTTVPLAAAAGGSPSRMLGVWQGSAAQQVRELVPESVAVAAAFHHLSAELLARDGPVDCDVLICSDDEEAKRVASELAEKISGARAVNGGKLENARIVESMTALLIGLNTRYKTRIAGIRFTGLPR
jgi:NADPH-dependent F420 reductase